MKILSIFNNKGGVGKSTLAFHLGSALSEKGKKVLLIDLDPQSNLSLYGLSEDQLEGIWNSEDEFISDYKAAKEKISNEDFLEFNRKNHSIHYILKPIEDGESDEIELAEPVSLNENLDLIPGRLTLHIFENKLAKHWSEAFLGDPQAIRIVTAIRNICKKYAEKNGYDIVIIDTSPSLGTLNKIIISNADGFIIPCAPDMFSLYGIKNIGNALSLWKREFRTMYSLLSDSKRNYFKENFVKLIGFTIYNAKKRSDAPNNLQMATAHYNHAKQIPSTILTHIPKDCLLGEGVGYFDGSIGDNSVIHGHATIPTMSQKYKVPMWAVPGIQNLGDDKATISLNSDDYYKTKDKYHLFADDVISRLEAL